MQHGIHPTYRPVAFRDRSADLVFVSGSTLTSSETTEIDGSVEKFRSRYGLDA